MTTTATLAPPAARARRNGRIRGSITIETAIAFGVFVSLVLSSFDVSYIFFHETILKHAVQEAGRVATTGRVVAAAAQSVAPATRLDTILYTIRQQSHVNVPPTAVEISSVNAKGIKSPGPGGPGDVVSIRVRYDLPLLTPVLGRMFPGGHYTVDVGTSFKNEEF
jgi:hypothetical protein